MYSHPGVSEIIYRNEWSNTGRWNRRSYKESESNESLLLVIFAIIIAMASIVLLR